LEARAHPQNRARIAGELVALADRVAATATAARAARPTRGPPLLVGFSQGAMLTWTTAIEHPSAFGAAFPIAGFGVANPNGMLLAVALMLGEGLGERAAARTLVRAASDAVGAGVLTSDMMSTGVAATTREFVDVVLGELLRARRDVEYFMESPA